MRTNGTGRVFASILVMLLLFTGCATGGASSQSPAPSPSPALSTGPRTAVGVGVGTGGVHVGGAVSPSSTDPVTNSVMMGFMIGSVGGPIGALVGAGVGYIHGLAAKKELARQVQLEADRQKKLDQDLERQILARRGGALDPTAPSPDQGVIIVKDHLGEEANPPGPAAPTRGPAPARVPPQGVDSERFKAVYEGGRLVRRVRDVNGNGKPDVILHYDDNSQLVLREESSQLDGRIDTWTYYAHGKVERKESDTDGDGRVDLWAYYSPEGDLIRLESLVDHRRKLTQFYAEGKVVREEWRLEPGDQLQARLTYQDGKVTQKEEDTAGSGRLDLVSIFNEAGQLVKQGPRGEDGQILAWRYFDPAGTLLREEEIGKAGAVEAVAYYDNGKLARRELYEVDGRLFKRVPLVSEGPPAGGG